MHRNAKEFLARKAELVRKQGSVKFTLEKGRHLTPQMVKKWCPKDINFHSEGDTVVLAKR